MLLSPHQLEEIADRFRILGEVMRLKLLAAMSDGEKTVSELVELTGGNQANISRHLSALHRGKIVDRRKNGTWVYYSIADPTVFDVCKVVCKGDIGR